MVGVRGLLREKRVVAGVIGTAIATFERLHPRLHREARDHVLIRGEVRYDAEKRVARAWR